MRNTLIILALVTGLVACQPEGRIYNEHQELSPKLEWLKKDIREFKVPIKDKNMACDLRLSFRYTTGYQYQTANVKVTETSPSGKVSVKEYELKVKEANGDYIGKPGLNIWDSEHLIEANKKYDETGIYTYVIEQNTSIDPLKYVMEIGVILDNTKE